MLTNIFTKAVRDNWRGVAITVFVLALMLWFVMAMFKNVDLSFYSQMPEVLRSMLGIPANADVGSLAVGELFGSYGTWILVGIAIAAGSASIAGEEGNGTIGLLLGNPRSRTSVLVSKAASLLLLTAVGVAAIWGSAYLAAWITGVHLGSLQVGALGVHLFATAIFFGFLAMAIGAWTGSRGNAAGITAGVMFVSIFAVGLLPLIHGWENVAKIFPWYYFNGSLPLINGIDWAHIGILSIGIVVFAIISIVGVNRRDLKSRNVGSGLLDRLRTHPSLRKIIDRLGGSSQVNHIWTKTVSDHQALLVITGYVMFLVMGILIGPIYHLIPSNVFDMFNNFPQALLAGIGAGNMSTPEGFYQAETFGLMAPIALMLVTIVVGAGALAGEEERRTMGLLLANPIKRSRVVIEKTWAMVIAAFISGLIIFAGVWLGSLIGRLGMSAANIAATCLLVTLLGLAVGAIALALSAATGRSRVAVYGSVGLALVFYITSSFLPLNTSLAGLAKLSPYYYYLSSDPLMTGMDWAHGAILAGVALVFIILAVPLFQRRDLHYNG